MRILIREHAKKWTYAESVRAEAEAELQSLLVESPSLINVDEIRERTSQLVLAISEFGLVQRIRFFPPCPGDEAVSGW